MQEVRAILLATTGPHTTFSRGHNVDQLEEVAEAIGRSECKAGSPSWLTIITADAR